jgi:tRNA(adenine34) deaminase
MVWRTLSLPWRAAVEEAWDASRHDCVPIGSVIVDGDSAVVARGRNRMFEPTGASPHIAGTRLAHAEVNALYAFASTGLDPSECAVYTTTEPCVMCIGAIRMHRIPTVHYAARDPLAGGAALAAATPFMREGLTSVRGPQCEELEQVMTALLAEFLTRRHQSPWADLVEALHPSCTIGTRLGRRLAESGELARLADERRPAVAAIDFIAQELG